MTLTEALLATWPCAFTEGLGFARRPGLHYRVKEDDHD